MHFFSDSLKKQRERNGNRALREQSFMLTKIKGTERERNGNHKGTDTQQSHMYMYMYAHCTL